jgi:hypothetical protein
LWGQELSEAEIERLVVEHCGTTKDAQVVLISWEGG